MDGGVAAHAAVQHNAHNLRTPKHAGAAIACAGLFNTKVEAMT